MSRFKIFITIVLALSVSISSLNVAAQYLNSEQKSQLNELSKSTLQANLSYDIIESLTTEVGHRMLGSPGDKKSIVWAVDKMNALGFDKVWTQEVTGSYWRRGEAKARIVAPYPHDLVVLALGGSVATAKRGLTATIAHFETFADLKMAPDDSLNGKIAFVSYRMTRDIDGTGYGPAVGTRVNGAVVAAQKGASALVMRSVGTDNNRIAHTGVMRYKDNVAKIPAAALSNPDADLLLNQLKRGKDVSMYLNITALTDAKVVAKSANVIGEFTGSELPNEIVTLGAHLDSWDVGTGAVDDGIGVGIVLAAAHNIGKLAQRPKRTIRVILFAAEEVGLLGAKQYVKNPENNIAEHAIGSEWDFGTGRIYKMTPGVGAQSLNAVRELAQYLAPLGVALAPENNAKGQSDMSALSDLGMPSIDFAPDGTDYFDYHHTENDTLDKVDPEALKVNTTIYTMYAYFAAQAMVDFRK